MIRKQCVSILFTQRILSGVIMVGLFLLLFLTGTVLAATPGWQPVNYTQSTTAVGIVTIDGQPAESGDIVGAFVGDECRGVIEVNLNDGTAYMGMVINGDLPGETVAFRIYDSSEEQVVDVMNTCQTSPGDISGEPPNYLDINGMSLQEDPVVIPPILMLLL